MSPCADSLFYFFTSYSHIRILSLRTPLIRFFQCRFVRIHCFTFSHRIPTFEFFLLAPPLTRFFKCRLVRIHCSPFFTSYSHIRILSLRTPLIRFFQCRFVRIHCSTFFTSYSHIRILSLRTPLIRFFQCSLVRIHCFTFLHRIPTFEFFLLGPRSLDFSNVALCGFIVLLFYIVFPHSNSFS